MSASRSSLCFLEGFFVVPRASPGMALSVVDGFDGPLACFSADEVGFRFSAAFADALPGVLAATAFLGVSGVLAATVFAAWARSFSAGCSTGFLSGAFGAGGATFFTGGFAVLAEGLTGATDGFAAALAGFAAVALAGFADIFFVWGALDLDAFFVSLDMVLVSSCCAKWKVSCSGVRLV